MKTMGWMGWMSNPGLSHEADPDGEAPNGLGRQRHSQNERLS